MVVVTRNLGFSAEGVLVAHSVEEALSLVRDDSEPFIGGGAEIYRQALEAGIPERLYITRVRADVEGDTFFPPLDLDEWFLADRVDHPADEKNEYPHTFDCYDRP